MMKLSVMREIVDTLDERGRSPIAAEILSCWQHDNGTERFFRSSANFVFTFQNQARDFILRFNHSTERTPEWIQAELDYLNDLAAQGIPVARPVKSLRGSVVETVSTRLGRYHAVVFERLPGEQYDTEELPPHLLAPWGKALGELHRASRGYPGTGRPSWKDKLAQAADMIPAEETAARKTLEVVDRDLSQLPVSRDNFGLIHFDFELDNLLWQEDRPWIIDFDSCTCSWFAADIAFALRDLFADRADRVDPGDQRFLAFLDGYRQARELPQEEIDWIPLFLQMHNLVTFAGLYRSMEAGPCSDDPTWLVHLREKLTRKQAAYRDGFCQYTKRING